MIEQIYYTWADRGLEGLGRFQFVAASRGLRDMHNPLLDTLIRPLCLQPSRQDSSIVSFGWTQGQGFRLIFRRISTGTTGGPRGGGFAAHIVLAPIAELELRHMLGSQSDEFWWDGRPPTSPDLPHLSSAPPRPSAEPDVEPVDVTAALASLIDQGFRGRVASPWGTLLTALVMGTATVPELLHDLVGFSTYEEGKSAAYFPVSGGPESEVSARTPSDSALAAARLVASPDPSIVSRARGVVADSQVGASIDWRRFTSLATAMDALVNSGHMGVAGLLPGLASPGAAEQVLLDPEGRSIVATALANADGRVSDALRRGAVHVPEDLCRQCGYQVAECSASDDRTISAAFAALTQLPPSFSHGFADYCPRLLGAESGHDAASWPLGLLILCIAQ